MQPMILKQDTNRPWLLQSNLLPFLFGFQHLKTAYMFCSQG